MIQGKRILNALARLAVMIIGCVLVSAVIVQPILRMVGLVTVSDTSEAVLIGITLGLGMWIRDFF